ncbi:hypothetical protein V8G54_009373 [Vigna mungo]|uniref:Uncharacterized protein n=1 Tax=Vigna mungo TaxID=3915 RepID=A0AAQ3NTV4_VIGMU
MRIYLLLLGHVDGGSPPLGSSRSWKSMEMEIQSLLEKLLDINDSMSRCAASAGPATSVTQKLARHRDILHEFTQLDLWFEIVKEVIYPEIPLQNFLQQSFWPPFLSSSQD